MATDSQIHANRENAQQSTGPRSEAGKAASSRNALTHGLFTKSDYVRPEQQEEYNELVLRFVNELSPAGVLEETFVTAIVSAAWRLRRCALVEKELSTIFALDPMEDAAGQRTQTSIDRARSQAFNILRRSTAELRRLQTDRAIAAKLEIETPPLASARQMVTAIDQARRANLLTGQDLSPQNRSAEMNSGSLGSNCNPSDQTPRNAPCPCGSGEKFKRCCGKVAPPVLGPVGKVA